MTLVATADPFVPLPYRVQRARRELSDITTLDLVPLAGELAAFQPGQFNMLYAFGVGEAAISVSGDPAEPGRIVHTVRAVGAVSGASRGLARASWWDCVDRSAQRGRPRKPRATMW
jgi:NAD(P)H-flavin reductase